MADPLCAPCKARGREVKATRLVPKTPGSREHIPKCEDCHTFNRPVELAEFEKPPVFPPAEPIPHIPRLPQARVGKKGFQPVHTRIDWPQAQASREAGTPVSQIAKSLGVTAATVYARTKPARQTPARRIPRKVQAPAKSAEGARRTAANALDPRAISYVPLAEVPGRSAQVSAFYLAVYEALKKLPPGQAVRAPVSAEIGRRQNPAGALRSSLLRLARSERRPDLAKVRFRSQGAVVWVYLEK